MVGTVLTWVLLTVLIINWAVTPMCSFGPIVPVSHRAEPYITTGLPRCAVTVRGDFVLNGTWVPDDVFDEYVGKHLAESRSRSISLAADREVPYSRVKAAIRRLSELGVERVYLETSQDGLGMVLAQAWLQKEEI